MASGYTFRKTALAAVMLGCLVLAQPSFASANGEPPAATRPASTTEGSGGLPSLPPLPAGKTTVIGGQIHNVDLVRDQFMLKVFGGRPMKVLFDARTGIYRDGIKIPPSDLRSDDHAAVETVLDGTNVFALSIHMLSRSPQGEVQGQLLSYDPATRELSVSSALSNQPVKLLVPVDTAIVREGQGTFSSASPGAPDLVKGSLISVKFRSDNDGRGVASRIAILATPGSAFVFSGTITFLDMHSGFLVLVDPRDNKSYQVFFDSTRFPLSRSLHEGQHVTVTANFTGARYVASAMAL